MMQLIICRFPADFSTYKSNTSSATFDASHFARPRASSAKDEPSSGTKIFVPIKFFPPLFMLFWDLSSSLLNISISHEPSFAFRHAIDH